MTRRSDVDSVASVYRLHVRVFRVGGVDELHGVVTEAGAGTSPDLDWNDLQAAAVERWETSLNPPDSAATRQQLGG